MKLLKRGKMEKGIIVKKEDYEILIHKYQGAKGIIDKKIKYYCDRYNKKPFDEKEISIWVNEIKDFIPFTNLNYKINKKRKKVAEKKEENEEKPKKPIKKLTKEEIEKNRAKLLEIYNNLIEILKRYCDIKEEYYNIIALWIMGTYVHNEFETYPYLFINAMKGSGKTRLLKLITHLSKNGEMMLSIREAVLFRTKGMLGIDEFEGINRKGNEALRELLNASYKKGMKVKRMRKVHTKDGDEQVVEEFEPYRPICLANIWGMEQVLGDRCINIILERSDNNRITRLMELFHSDSQIETTLRDSLCQVSFMSSVDPQNIYRDWNTFTLHISDNNKTITTLNTYTYFNNINNINNIFFNKILETNLNGRELELSFPLFIIANYLNEDILDKTINTITNIMRERKEEEFNESIDVSL